MALLGLSTWRLWSIPAPFRWRPLLAALLPSETRLGILDVEPQCANLIESSSVAAGIKGFASSAMTKVKRKGSKALPPPEEGGTGQRQAALDAALMQIECSFGSGSVMRMGDMSAANKDIAVIPTGSLALDAALGVGGLPKGRVVEIFGPEASGKTTLALHVVAEAQKLGGTCVFIDAEHALDATFAEAIGVRTADLLISQPDSGEQALAVADTFIRSGSVDVVVVDSVAALVPKAELAGEMGDAHMALQARLMSQALRKLTHSLSKSDTLLIFINQIRNKLSTFGGFGGPQEVTSGGNALKFYSSVRLNIRRIAYVKKGEEVVGSTVRVKIAKNKVAPPFRSAEFDIEFGRGISQEGELLDIGVREGILQKSGAWYSYKGENFAQGKDKGKHYLRDNSQFSAELTVAVREKLRSSLLERRDSTSGTTLVEDESVEEEDLEKDEFGAEAVG